MTAIVGLVLPIAAAWFALLATGLVSRHQWWPMTAVLAFGAGIGLSSITTLLFITHGVPLDTVFVALDAGLWLLIAGIAAFRRPRRSTSAAGHAPTFRSLTAVDWLVRLGFAAVAALVLWAQVVEYMGSPHGQWDAWAIWNQKARFLVRGGTEDWRGMLSIPWANPGHPMLVSASVARLWAYAGSETTLVPAALAVLLAAGIVTTVVAALDPRRPRAWIAGAATMAPSTFVHQVAAQTADLPIAFFVLVALVQLRDAFSAGTGVSSRNALVLCGLFVGIAAWTKNEGLVLAAGTAALLAWLAIRRRTIAGFAWWAGGAAIPSLTVIWYKLAVAPVAPEYMPATETVGSITARVFDPARALTVASLAGSLLVHWGGTVALCALPAAIAAALAASTAPAARPLRYLLLVLAIMTASYVLLWLAAPIEPAWLVTTTFDRLMIQLWPTLVVIAFTLGLGAPRPE